MVKKVPGKSIRNSRTGNRYDNAAMEGFIATLKGECATRPYKPEAELSPRSSGTSKVGTIDSVTIHPWAI
jgi:transposase InsO family protein